MRKRRNNMPKNKDSLKSSDTHYYPADYKAPASVDSSNLVRDRRADYVYDTRSSPLSFIEAKNKVQGGKYCFRGTRVPILAIRNAIKDGCTYTKMAATLKKYFRLDIPSEEIKNAVREYDQLIGEYA